MKTEMIKIDRDDIDLMEMKRAGEILKKGGLVAFPTETVYGLGGDALDETAAHRIYEAKGRPSDNPLIVHIADMDKIVEEVPEAAHKLAEAFWPGPLTMIMNKSDAVPHGTTGGLDTVAIRMPSDPIALELIVLEVTALAIPKSVTLTLPSLDIITF